MMARLATLSSPQQFTKIPYQFLFIGINALLCVTMLYKPITTFISSDPPPQLHALTPDSVTKFGGTSLGHKVETGINIVNFDEFDLTKNNFIISALIWFKFDPSLVSLETVGKFSFEKGDVVKKSKPETKLVQGKLLARYNVKVRFSTNLDYKTFPLNSHRIYLKLVNKSVSPKEIVFESYESGLSVAKDIFVSGWQKKGHAVATGYTQAQLDRHDTTTTIYHPSTLYSIDFVRSGIRQIFVAFFPLFFVLYLSFLTFSMHPEGFGSLRLTISIANISAVLGYRFIIEKISPTVGYFMLSDHVFNLLLATVFFIFFFNLSTHKESYLTLKGTVLVLLHTTFLSIWYYLLYIWINV